MRMRLWAATCRRNINYSCETKLLRTQLVCSNSPFKIRVSVLLSRRNISRPTFAEYFIYFNIILPYNTGISSGLRCTVTFTSH